jgi:hypothetical protein
MEYRRHRSGPDSDEIPRRRRTGLVRDNQTDLDLVRSAAQRSEHARRKTRKGEQADVPEEMKELMSEFDGMGETKFLDLTHPQLR